MNDEPTQPTMREQIEGLIGELNQECIECVDTINGHPHLTYADQEYLSGKQVSLDSVIARLRAILASPDAVSAEKGTTARV